MASPSKEENVLKLILENSPMKEWHFSEIAEKAGVTKLVANKWLKKYLLQGLLHHIKEDGKFPFFTVGPKNPVYYSLKRVYALDQLHKSGLLPKLLSLEKARTVILFGSMAKGDWYENSDIDIFVLGNLRNFDKKVYELKLKRRIDLHIFRSRHEISEVKTGLIQNIINGYVIKGHLKHIK